MSNWKINRLSIDSFKLFDKFDENLNQGLTVFDGPNGFGKTSVFDALQLLFCGNVPRISALAKSIKLHPSKRYGRNLYWNKDSERSIVIKAELIKENDTVCIMRFADKNDLEHRNNSNPNNFDIFKLFELTSFDNEEIRTELSDDDFSSIFGEDFRKNYLVLNYLAQENKPIVIPDQTTDNASRHNLITHLLNLTEVDEKIDKLNKVIKVVNTLSVQNFQDRTNKDDEIGGVKFKIIGGNSPSYKQLSDIEDIPIWDKENPLLINRDICREQVRSLKELITNKDQVEIKLKNSRIEKFIQSSNFEDTIRVGNHLSSYQNQFDLNTQIKQLNSEIELLELSNKEFSFDKFKSIKTFLTDEEMTLQFQQSLNNWDKLQKVIDNNVETKTKLNGLRKELTSHVSMFSDFEDECPLCGYNYEEKQLLKDAIDIRTKHIEEEIGEIASQFENADNALIKLKRDAAETLHATLNSLNEKFSATLLSDLEKTKNRWNAIQATLTQIEKYSITLPEIYLPNRADQVAQLELVQENLRSLKKNEDDSVSNDVLSFLEENFKTTESIKGLTIDDCNKKIQYLKYQFELAANADLTQKKKELDTLSAQFDKLNKLKERLTDSINLVKQVKNDYVKKTIGQMEYLFHIYSGRLIQNFQEGLGLFIHSGDTSLKNQNLNFLTSDKTYDAILSLSSGQTAALTLAFFLSLNRMYSQTDFVLIDDPTQSMDEINIASLSDLLRVELREKQVIISTHEQNIADYLRYRYFRAGLEFDSINMQRISQNSEDNQDQMH